jgi:hypothetical protein
MKNSLHFNPILLRMVLLIACFMLVIMYNKSKAADIPSFLHSNNKAIVNFKSDAEKNILTISLKSGKEGILQLFIFTAEGILINEAAVSAGKITTVKGLKKGLYFYECFDNNERMKSGSLLIK